MIYKISIAYNYAIINEENVNYVLLCKKIMSGVG